MIFSKRDSQMMARALLLAECGAYTTKPNPMVGCVIARGDKIVGEGFHQRAGEPHAEVFALREAGESSVANTKAPRVSVRTMSSAFSAAAACACTSR